MKQWGGAMLRDEILNGAAEVGVSLDGTPAGLLARHLEMVLEANRSMNLTAIESPDKAVLLHVVDSLAALPEISGAPEGDLADMGSGAGYPGIPLSIVAGRHVTLIESVRKKASFLQEVVVSLDLDADVRPERVEEVAAAARGRYGIVTARALAELPSLVELASPLLHRGGRLVAYKGPIGDSELARGDRAGEVTGMERRSVRRYVLPAGPERSVVVYEKAGEPARALPRRTGLAQKRPLG